MDCGRLFCKYFSISCAKPNETVLHAYVKNMDGNWDDALHFELAMSVEDLKDECIQIENRRFTFAFRYPSSGRHYLALIPDCFKTYVCDRCELPKDCYIRHSREKQEPFKPFRADKVLDEVDERDEFDEEEIHTDLLFDTNNIEEYS